jgi:hypothetical protein
LFKAFLQLVFILIILAIASFFSAMMFRFVIQIQNDVYNWGRFFSDNTSDEEEPENFMSFYGIYERTDFE